MNMENDRFSALEKELYRRGADGAAITSALKDYYSIFDLDVVRWLGRLYDPEIGGFYYSNSSRDNEYVSADSGTYRLLPDVESTEQALRFLKSSGIVSSFEELPPKMREGISRFVCSLEDPETGFFYHPQWSREMVDANPSRRGRDVRWAIAVSKALGFDFPYPTAIDRLSGIERGEEKKKLPEYLYDKSKFLEYLNSFDWNENAYVAGNAVSAQSGMINASGLLDVAIDFLDNAQVSSTGLWGTIGGHTAINAYLKISNFYSTYNKPLKNTDKAMNTVLECIVSDGEVNTVCWQYNVWCAAKNILNNTKLYGKQEDADSVLKNLYSIAPEAIASTKRKALTFKKSDGSFSFKPKCTSHLSQGLPVALKNTDEGDVNATLICTSATTENLFLAMDLGDFDVPIFSESALPHFLSAAKSI